MPYLLLVIGLLIGFYVLYRFFISATVDQIKAFALAAVAIILGIALFFMAITGRLPAAIALVGALLPVVLALWKMKKGGREKTAGTESSAGPDKPRTRADALEILGLEDGASEEDIKNAYKKLIKKVHPDHEGSEWMTAKLNQARDILLGKD